LSIRAINWAREVCERIGAPSKHRLVLLMLALHHHDKTGECFPSYETIAKACGFSRRSVIDLVSDLETNGLLVRQKRRDGGHQGSNHYVLFGRPSGKKWIAARVHKTTPCESANGGTLSRVQTGAPCPECKRGHPIGIGYTRGKPKPEICEFSMGARRDE
jgi:biotin operon repressor